MSLIALGLNHRTAPVEVRERLAFSPEALPGALDQIRQVDGVNEAAIISTCNRTEIYCDIVKPSEREIVNWFREFHRLPAENVEPYLFRHSNGEAVRHLLRVATGLDSLVLGEPQILGQVKTAFLEAQRSGVLGSHLNRLFQHAFTVAKQIRTDTAIGSSPVSVAFAAVSLARQIFGDFNRRTALLIGAGETIELALRHLHGNGIGRVIIANRTRERARLLAETVEGEAIELTAIPEALPKADIVISSTASPLPILGKGAVERALKQRKHKPMFMVDIAVPRDIEPEVSELDDVFLYTVDDLEEVIQENLESRREAAAQAEEIIDTQVEHFMQWLRSLDSVGTIKNFRTDAERTKAEVRAQAGRLLSQGRPADEVLDYLANTLTQKLIHKPTARLREAGRQGHSEIIEAARELFAIKDDNA